MQGQNNDSTIVTRNYINATLNSGPTKVKIRHEILFSEMSAQNLNRFKNFVPQGFQYRHNTNVFTYL